MASDLLQSPADAAAAHGGTAEIKREGAWLELKHAGRLGGRYLQSDPLWGALLILLKIAIIGASSVILLQFQLHLAGVTNGLVAKDTFVIWSGLRLGALMILLMFALALTDVFVDYTLRIRMRAVFTQDLVSKWMTNNRFYRLQMENEVDHPEQRIQEDTFIFCQSLLLIVPPILGRLLDIYLYSNQLWLRSPPMSLSGIGIEHTTKATMLVIAWMVGIGMTVIVHLIGNSLTRAEIARQRLEALYRAEMAEIRDSAEAVAFEKGARIEQERFSQTFDLIRRNWRWYTIANAKLAAVLQPPTFILLILATTLSVPFVLNGTMQIGDVQIISGSFLAVFSSVGVIATNYREIATLRAAAERMRFFSDALDRPPQSGITVQEKGNCLAVHDLDIRYPDGEPMVESFSFVVNQGDRLLVKGRSGAGKSTLLRALAGLWPYGSGKILLPANGKVSYLPQRSYMPQGKLAALLTYPAEPDGRRYSEYAELLNALDLQGLVGRMDEHNDWRRVLSPGQQQRIAAIRAVLGKPDFLFLDEGTSALDSHSEANLYSLLAEKLPDAAIISIAHRREVERFHSRTLEIRDNKVILGATSSAN